MTRCWKCGEKIGWNEAKNRSGMLCKDASERLDSGRLPWWHTRCFESTPVDRVTYAWGSEHPEEYDANVS